MVKGKKILITGGTGFIGSNLVKKFSPQNEITIFDNGRRNSFQFLDSEIKKNVRIVKGDILQQSSIKKALKNQDMVLHLAAIAGAPFYKTDPLLTLNVNLFGTHNLLQALVNSEIKYTVLFSSSEVYGGDAEMVSEEDPTCIGPISNGRWSYAASKAASDHVAIGYFKKYKIPLSIVRPFNIYGPLLLGDRAIHTMLVKAIKEKQIIISNLDKKQKRAWCYIDDFIDAIELLIESQITGECYNIGNPKEYYSMFEVIKILQQLTGAKLIKGEVPTKEIINRLPITTKATRDLHFKPKITLKEGLKQTYLWHLENIDKL